MLVLSRRPHESIVIGEVGDSVEVVILEIGSGRVRLGIMGPREIPVRRKETDRPIDELRLTECG